MPMRVTRNIGSERMDYESPFVGPVDHPAQVIVDVSGLTNKEIDDKGWLKPGVPLTRGGALIGSVGLSTLAAAVADDDNTGNGTVGSLLGKAGGASEVITLTARDATHFEVRGSVSGILGDLTVGTPYVSAAFNATLTAGGTPHAAGDQFTIIITADAPDVLFGVTIEEVDLGIGDNEAGSISGGTDIPVGVALIAAINQDVAEDMLDRAYTAAELAAFAVAGRLVLI